MGTLADEFGVKRDGPGRRFLLAYQLARKYDPRFAPPPPPKRRRGAPGYKNERYKAALAMAAAAADRKGTSHAKMAEAIATIEYGTKRTARPKVLAAKRQIETDASKLPAAHQAVAQLLTDSLANGYSIEQVRWTLEAMGCREMADTFLSGIEHHRNSADK
jgi:hypothetical protein